MTDDPRHFALQAALARMRVHPEQAVADNDAAIAAWDAIDDRRIDDEVEVTNFEDAEHQWQNAETGERRRGSPISAKPGDAGAPSATQDQARPSVWGFIS